jgi:inner membrane protein
VSILVGRRVLSRRDTTSDQPLLNQRAASLIGRTAIVSEAITNGRGRIKLDDTTWTAEGPDAAQGATVRITGNDGGKLVVEPV